MKTPEEVAASWRDVFEVRDGDVQETSWSYIEGIITEAIAADRAERVSTIDPPTIQEAVRRMPFGDHFTHFERGDLEADLTIDTLATGPFVEATVWREFSDGRPSRLLIRERLDFRPSLTSWVEGLLDRAQDKAFSDTKNANQKEES